MTKTLFRGCVACFLLLSKTLFCITSAELSLRKAYSGLGFSRRDSKVLCARLNDALKKALDSRALVETGVQPAAVAQLLAQGMLLDLSPQGFAKISTAASVFIVEYAPKPPQTLRAARRLCLEIKKFIFNWVAQQLSKYERMSFQRAYIFTTEKCAVDDQFMGYGDFVYDVLTQKEVTVLAGSSYSEVRVSDRLTGAFELLAIEEENEDEADDDDDGDELR